MDLMAELDTLRSEVGALRQQLLYPPPPQLTSLSHLPSRFSKWATNIKLYQKHSLTKRRLRRYDSLHRYDAMDEQGLMQRSPTSPTDTDRTETASDLLAILAPVVSSTQRLSARIRTDGLDPSDFAQICKELLEVLRKCQRQDEDDTDEHDLEMRDLLLEALIKKVQTELSAVESLSASAPVSPRRTDSLNPFASPITPTFTVRPMTFSAAGRSISEDSPLYPLNTHSPFVLHSASLKSPARARPISAPGGTPQASWLRDVVRLGSYQASALFSPSPVAVHR